MLYHMRTLYIYISKIKSVACHIAAKSCVSEVKLCFINSRIPYLKANFIFKLSFVCYGCSLEVSQ